MTALATGVSFLRLVRLAAAALALLVISASGAGAAETGALKTETALEKQVREIASKLRCPVCQGESIYDSHSDVAVEMKRLIADKIKAGESESQIIEYFHARYGNYILMAPPAEGLHWVIWIFPLFLGLVGVLFLVQYLAASKQAGDVEKYEADGDGETAGQDADGDIEELRL